MAVPIITTLQDQWRLGTKPVSPQPFALRLFAGYINMNIYMYMYMYVSLHPLQITAIKQVTASRHAEDVV